MNKIWLIARREFLNRVQKKSFLIATILVPLIFPAIIAVMVYLAVQQHKNADRKIVHYIDESGLLVPDTSKFTFVEFNGTLAAALDSLEKEEEGKSIGLLHIPKVNVKSPKGISIYCKLNPSPNDIDQIKRMLEDRIKDLKLKDYNIDKRILDSLATKVAISTIQISPDGNNEATNLDLLFAGGMAFGILIYMFIFIYGMQIMHGVIEEKSSKVIEVIVSSVKPFQLMMGKILGLASVGLLQFLIWIFLISSLSSLIIGLAVDPSQQDVYAQASQPQSTQFLDTLSQIPFGYMTINFLVYFLGGYLMYAALFAAVGSAVDSQSEASQFMFPITIPLLIAYMSLFIFIRDGHDEPIAVWLSLIPFTSPIAMMGRLGFGVPLWQLILSQVLLIGGFIFTTWVASRIYRVGILMHGTKVNYKVLAKWFMMKN
jgi:ABC-2 type transport system permease protein